MTARKLVAKAAELQAELNAAGLGDPRDARIVDLEDQVRRWREHSGRMRDRVVDLVRENFRLTEELILEQARHGQRGEQTEHHLLTRRQHADQPQQSENQDQ